MYLFSHGTCASNRKKAHDFVGKCIAVRGYPQKASTLQCTQQVHYMYGASSANGVRSTVGLISDRHIEVGRVQSSSPDARRAGGGDQCDDVLVLYLQAQHAHYQLSGPGSRIQDNSIYDTVRRKDTPEAFSIQSPTVGNRVGTVHFLECFYDRDETRKEKAKYDMMRHRADLSSGCSTASLT